jgi:choline kinase
MIMKAVILAAGASKRLRPYTDGIPKCLIQIGGKSILDHQLDAVSSAGIRDAVIVVGYIKQKIIESIDLNRRDFNSVSFIENPEYETTNTIYSLYLARDEFRGHDFIYFNADVLMHNDIVRMLVEHSGRNVLAVDYISCGDEEVKFVTDSRGLIISLGKYISSAEAEGEFIGVAKFSSRISDRFIESLAHYSRSGQKNLFFEKAVEDILHEDRFYPLDVSHIPNIEIDFPEDLEKAKNQVYPAIINYEALTGTTK